MLARLAGRGSRARGRRRRRASPSALARPRRSRRRALLGRALPEAVARVPARPSYDHYERLDGAWRARFEDDVRIFLAEKRITGVGVEVDDELRLLVAASAVTLSVGWPEYEWDQLTEVLLYPDDFDRDYGFGGDERAGEAHPWGTVILSVPALLESFEVPGRRVPRRASTSSRTCSTWTRRHFDGIPVGLGGAQAREWARCVAEREMERLRAAAARSFDAYGAEDPVEFLAVAVEAFFEVPQRVRRRHATSTRSSPRTSDRTPRRGTTRVACASEMRLDLLLIRRHPGAVAAARRRT